MRQPPVPEHGFGTMRRCGLAPPAEAEASLRFVEPVAGRAPRSAVGDTQARTLLPSGLLQRSHRSRWPRHGGRPRHRKHARIRAWARHRAVRAFGGGDRRPQRRGARRGPRGQADAGPHAGDHPGDPAPQGRGDRRLRRHGADAAPLHPEGAPEPLGASARRRVCAVRRDGRREARRRGGMPVGRRPPGIFDRGADGGRDRGRPAGRRADREHRRRHRRRHERGRGHLARRDRRLAVDPGRRRRDGRRDRELREARVQAHDRSADRGGDQARDRVRVPAARRRCRRRSAAATWSRDSPRPWC